MKSKKFILNQIKDTMLEKGHSEADADKYLDEIKESTVYELLVIKKEIKAPEPVIEDEDEEEDASYFRRLRGVVRYED
ncbi:hypothetical protein DSLPV1_069 [Dishui lake phycodnavirus 1]|uniref:hypothetical protein n=1 Tax=Dishui lake phycodnavirus 1 TaxID=2079134 RepID=UPI000CD695CE|nr:hypothetical protein C5Y57_gp069 [Dishui lake phycodnavirus 1]AUT19040.1 hypothetical protein DSLPV1_069 [Dishui lake phycodnavirus 1]